MESYSGAPPTLDCFRNVLRESTVRTIPGLGVGRNHQLQAIRGRIDETIPDEVRLHAIDHRSTVGLGTAHLAKALRQSQTKRFAIGTVRGCRYTSPVLLPVTRHRI